MEPGQNPDKEAPGNDLAFRRHQDYKGALAAAIEFKSQVGPSFGNNFNNRVSEALGNAEDLWTAYREGRFGDIRPWIGYLFLLEDAPKSSNPVRVTLPGDVREIGVGFVGDYETPASRPSSRAEVRRHGRSEPRKT